MKLRADRLILVDNPSTRSFTTSSTPRRRQLTCRSAKLETAHARVATARTDDTPEEPDERSQAPRTQADKWAANILAARQFHTREGSLQVPRKHVEVVDGVEHKLGMFVDNARRRADKLTAERHQELAELGMRW
ncbi:helicase associated domain-containing protein [Streptomyces sp. NBC_00433]